MSYYDSRVQEMRSAGVEVRELGDEIAIIDRDSVVVGGDAPTAYGLSGATDEQARELARLGRAVGADAETVWRDYCESVGASEIVW